MISVFVRAGYSKIAGLPLAYELFDEVPIVDRITRHKMVIRVTESYKRWKEKNSDGPEAFLNHLSKTNLSLWIAANWYVSIVLALKFGTVTTVGGQPQIVGHRIMRTGQNEIHRFLWDMIFKKTHDVTVITTNYDILLERELRLRPTPRKHRPGFVYENGREILFGRGYLSFAHLQPIEASGKVPILKLHGSLSWAMERRRLVKYQDCRPAIKGKALLVAPITDKTVPIQLQPIWTAAREALLQSNCWIIIGYSLPEYDQLVNKLLKGISYP